MTGTCPGRLCAVGSWANWAVCFAAAVVGRTELPVLACDRAEAVVPGPKTSGGLGAGGAVGFEEVTALPVVFSGVGAMLLVEYVLVIL